MNIKTEIAMNKNKRDFTEGPLFFKIFLFALPIMATGLLQVFYNMADKIVVGRFSGDPLALAAVGSVGTLNTLLVNLTLGIAVGGGIVVSQLFGAKKHSEVSDAVHTALTFSVFAGLFMGALGFIISPYVLELLGTKPELIDNANLYFRITMLGFPASMIYNFAASIIRSVGDSKTPLIILSISGLLNVLLNILFVLAFHMTVDGVAYATVLSQVASAVMIVWVFFIRKDECYALKPRRLRIHKPHLLRMLRIGIPSGLTSSVYSIANLALTGAVNTFSPAVVSANSIAGSVEGFTYTAMNCFQQSSMTFTGQNFGAKRYDRVRRVYFYSLIQVLLIGIFMGQIQLAFGEELALLYIDPTDPNRAEVLAHTMDILKVILSTYFLCGILEVSSGALRGLGCTMVTMIVSFIFACGVRLSYIFLVFFNVDALDTIGELNYAFPISWTTTIIAYLVAMAIVWRRFGISKKGQNKQIIVN